MNAVNQFLFTSFTGSELSTSDKVNWVDLPNLIVPVSDSETGSFVVTLTVPDTWNDSAHCGANFRIAFRSAHGTLVGYTDLGQGFYFSDSGGQRVPFSLVCLAEYLPDKLTNKAIVAQWRASQGGTAHIGPLGRCSLVAVGSTKTG